MISRSILFLSGTTVFVIAGSGIQHINGTGSAWGILGVGLFLLFVGALEVGMVVGIRIYQAFKDYKDQAVDIVILALCWSAAIFSGIIGVIVIMTNKGNGC